MLGCGVDSDLALRGVLVGLALVGLALGAAVGLCVGAALGLAVGLCVGAALGLGVAKAEAAVLDSANSRWSWGRTSWLRTWRALMATASRPEPERSVMLSSPAAASPSPANAPSEKL
jgi:hypothetical protein